MTLLEVTHLKDLYGNIFNTGSPSLKRHKFFS